MLLLRSISQNRIWGTDRLKEYGGTSIHTGSVYSVSGIAGIDCEVLNVATGEKTSLLTLARTDPEALGLLPGENYPIIIDLLGADEHLSIQVHPVDNFAKKQGYLYGKSESWYFITKPHSGKVFAGLKQKYQNNLNLEMVKEKPLAIVDEVDVSDGDYLYVPAGTLHAIQKGSLVYEIQQSTDVTYRFYDYDRLGLDGNKRKLDAEDAYKNLKIENQIKKSMFSVNSSISELPYKLEHRYFKDAKWHNEATIACAITVIQGSLGSDENMISQGQSCLIMPNEVVQFSGDAEVIIATPSTYWR